MHVFGTFRDDKEGNRMRYLVLLRNTDTVFGYLFEKNNADEIWNEFFKLRFSVFETNDVSLEKSRCIRMNQLPYMIPAMKTLRMNRQARQGLESKGNLHWVKTIELQIKNNIMKTASLKRSETVSREIWRIINSKPKEGTHTNCEGSAMDLFRLYSQQQGSPKTNTIWFVCLRNTNVYCLPCFQNSCIY